MIGKLDPRSPDWEPPEPRPEIEIELVYEEPRHRTLGELADAVVRLADERMRKQVKPWELMQLRRQILGLKWRTVFLLALHIGTIAYLIREAG